jgi:hypothetical protein
MATVVEVNCTTGERTERETTPAEDQIREADAAAAVIAQAEADAVAAEKAEAKERGDAKLLALGLTAEEIAAR